MNETIEYQNIHGNRKYKDSLFAMAFKRKEYLLDLYNAVNGTCYQNPDDLEINTLENVLYMTMKNDVSFLIGCTMNLYEHQSTKNENMPLRGLMYFSKLYETYVNENALDIYSSKLQKLPTPKYIVFYNGEENEPDERMLRLSDAFIKEGGCLECEVRLLNINYGRNRELMEKCRRLEEYAIFVARVRKYMSEENMTLKKSITLAMEECIEEGILVDILRKQRDEVLGVLLTSFNAELHEKCLKEDAYLEKLIEKVKLKLSKGKTIEEIADALEEDAETIKKIVIEITAE